MKKIVSWALIISLVFTDIALAGGYSPFKFDGISITNSVLTNALINSSPIGATTPSTGAFTTISSTGAFTQSFAGLSRQFTPVGGGLMREYIDTVAATTGNIEQGLVYNCSIIGGVWQGRDIADICWMDKYNDVGGAREYWYAPTGAAGTVPTWSRLSYSDISYIIYDGITGGRNFTFHQSPSDLWLGAPSYGLQIGALTNTNANHYLSARNNAGSVVFGVLGEGSTYSATGFLSRGIYGGTYTDGIAIDYATGNGRISVGAADGLTVYTGGIANTQMLAISSVATTVPNLNLTAASGIGTMLISSSAPTISSGFGTGASIGGSNGPGAFTINVGAGGVASSGVVALPTAANAWECMASVMNPSATQAKHTIHMISRTTSTVTLGNYDSSGTGGLVAWDANDVLNTNCFAR